MTDLRKIWNFLTRDNTGRFITVFALGLGLVVWFNLTHRQDQNHDAALASTGKMQAVSSQVTDYDLNVPALKPSLPPRVEAKPVPEEPAAPLPLNLYTSEETPLSPVYAPYGRLVPCELVITVDSSRIETPIVGRVIEDLWHDGQLIIPAGAEVHGKAQVDRSRERIASQAQWVIAWRTQDESNGLELPLSGLALAHLPDQQTRTWEIADGSAGLPGTVIKTDNLAELKVFAATFIAGLGQALSGQEVTSTFGSQSTTFDGSVRGAIANGVSQTANLYAQQMLQTIQRDGFFVRVPAGSTFYLYVTQTIDLAKARRGATQELTARK
jgi:hypothetical protein